MKTTATTLTPSVEKVKAEVREAYADLWLPFEQAANRRNLKFKASDVVTVREAIEIFKTVNPEFSYNEFTPDLLLELGEDTLVTIARDFSVCVFVHAARLVKSPKALQNRMKADEFNQIEPDLFRIWWD